MASFAQEDEPPLNEPVIVPCVFANGFGVMAEDHVLRMVGWVTVPAMGGETRERRIISRIVITPQAARRLARQLIDQADGKS